MCLRRLLKKNYSKYAFLLSTVISRVRDFKNVPEMGHRSLAVQGDESLWLLGELAEGMVCTKFWGN
ncbi:hypothetical protein CDL15_Pgr000357 [Punica granatum]|uniref:Uncharacterized protein n=1 Tax=Punica granatum TaxID=22663 RepID=A0A218XSZ2_PUNGR|nr:hypothetical protein CDL15_Pgr000357 [Punica granatum]